MTETPHRGRLKVYLGYAAGVGKTFQMLDDAQEWRHKGHDIVIGYFEPHGRRDTIAKSEGFELVPRRKIAYRGAAFEEMDTDAILRRMPEVCIVDELAHTNVPGSERAKRWEDVRVLLDHGIDVFTTVNVQHLESLNDQIFEITGVRVRETLPDWVLDEADDVVMIDLTPAALRNRLIRGAVYPPEKAVKALEHFFKVSNLSALREIALRHAAHEAEERSAVGPQAAEPALPARPRERVLICLTAKPTAAMLIRRGKRVADYLHADCLAVYVRGRDGEQPESGTIEKHLTFARNLRIEVNAIEGADVAQAIVDFARQRGVTHIFIGHPEQHPWYRPFQRSAGHQIVERAKDMQITIVAERRR